MSRVFWDTNLFIYLFEESGLLTERVVDLRTRMLERGDRLMTSSLTIGEILVKPIERNREDLARRYQQAIRSTAQVIPFDDGTALAYARIRSRGTIRPADAVQLACAAHARCDLFVTNDQRLSRLHVEGIGFIASLDRAPL